MRKVANVLVQKGIFTPEIRPCVVEILLEFPTQFVPQLNAKEFKTQLKLSLISQITKIVFNSDYDDQRILDMHMIDFIKELHAKSAIESNAIEELVIDVANNCVGGGKIFMLVQCIKAFEKIISNISEKSTFEMEQILEFHLTQKLSENELRDIKDSLQILRTAKLPKEKVEVVATTEDYIPSTSKACNEGIKNQTIESLLSDMRLQTVDQMDYFVDFLTISSLVPIDDLASKYLEAAVKSMDPVPMA